MRPYYEGHGATLYLGDCRDIFPSIEASSVALLLTDPPYGNNERTERNSAKRSAATSANDFVRIIGNAEPFDPTPLTRFPRSIIWGANYFAGQLPPSNSWLVWDKLNGLQSKRPLGFNDNGDAELAWTNLGGPVRLIPHRWMGMLKESEQRERRVHPTQKPIALMRAIIEFWTTPGDLVLDPYAGSGSTVIAAIESGRRAIGIEIEPQYADAIVSRIEARAA